MRPHPPNVEARRTEMLLLLTEDWILESLVTFFIRYLCLVRNDEKRLLFVTNLQILVTYVRFGKLTDIAQPVKISQS